RATDLLKQKVKIQASGGSTVEIDKQIANVGKEVVDAKKKELDATKAITDTMMRGEALLANFEAQMKLTMAVLERFSAAGAGGLAMANAEGGKGLMHFQAENAFKNPLAFSNIGGGAMAMAGQFGPVGAHTEQAAGYLQAITGLEKEMPHILEKASHMGGAAGPGGTPSAMIAMSSALAGNKSWDMLPDELKKAKLAEMDKAWKEN